MLSFISTEWKINLRMAESTDLNWATFSLTIIRQINFARLTMIKKLLER